MEHYEDALGCGLGTAKALRNLDGPGRSGAAIQRSAVSTQFTKLRAAVAAGATFKNGSKLILLPSGAVELF